MRVKIIFTVAYSHPRTHTFIHIPIPIHSSYIHPHTYTFIPIPIHSSYIHHTLIHIHTSIHQDTLEEANALLNELEARDTRQTQALTTSTGKNTSSNLSQNQTGNFDDNIEG